MGRGRTTIGTVIACLVKLQIDYGRPIKVLVDDVNHEELDSDSSSEKEAGGIGAAFGIDNTRLFDNGVECRDALDAIIDRCSALLNIRQTVLFNQQHFKPKVKNVALKRGAEYLEQYLRLSAFAAYLRSEALDGFYGQGEPRMMTFKSRLCQRPEVQAIKWSIRSKPAQFFTVHINPSSLY
ncbi:hypothetical protein Dsin_021264 [Dipteronia sinensis]|uniref:Uncharacterized protein n=1 Tax=Dipteronia sinensis TaxID=43782 RepID=A0AAD9ZZV3_9ROSI|nr:hypothetical protein Dsin_021264 [Dipteronia sinensis]